jgi:tetratricopeptide (TPR) repeat protein
VRSPSSGAGGQERDSRYTLTRIQSLLGLSRSVIDGLVAAGFVTPSRGKRGEYRFTFQDVVLMRTAHSLQAARIPPRKILQALRRLRERLPDELPLTGLRIGAVGSEVAVWEKERPLHADSGQWLIDFDVRAEPGAVARLAKATEVQAGDAGECFERGCALEADDPAQAEAAYREAIARAPDYADAYLNLGCLLCEASRCKEAVDVLRQGLQHKPGEALLHFNLGIALEDLGRKDEAVAAYEACLKLAPDLADAHYNVGRLNELMGRPSRAIRHYNEYRKLQR